MLSCFYKKNLKKNCVKFTSGLEPRHGLSLVSAFVFFFSYLTGMLEPGLDRTVHATGSRFTQSDRSIRSGIENYALLLLQRITYGKKIYFNSQESL